MRTIKLWMLAAILICGMTAGLVSCTANEDNTVSPSTETEEDYINPGIDPNEFQPIDISTALLGSLSSSADEEVVRYWFPKVTGQVTDETMVVITDEITEANKADIAKVLGRYGMLLVVEPSEENVKKYAGEMGFDPNADYSRLELLGLTGMGDQFLSFLPDDTEKAPADAVVPASLATDDIWNVAPGEYLRIKAFAEWVDQVCEKFAEYQNYLAEIDADFDNDVASTRGLNTEIPSLKLNKIPKIYRNINVTTSRYYESYVNASTIICPTDHETCYFSATCSYRIIPMYQYPLSAADPGGDYYLVDAMLSWDCSKTDMGYDKYEHATARDSYRFFPLKCTLYTSPKPTKSSYSVIPDPLYSLWPQSEKHETDIEENRKFSLEGNVAAGGGYNDGKFKGNVDANVGFGADYEKNQSYKVQEVNIDAYIDKANLGHVFSVPNDYHPIKETRHTPTIYSPKGVSFSKTFNTPESWLWKVNGTQMDTMDPSISLEFVVKPVVAWYSYFFAAESLDRRTYDDVTMKGTADLPAPYRMNIGYMKINANLETYHIFEVKAIDVTDPAKPQELPDSKGKCRNGNSVTFALVGGRTYNIEIKMGPTRSDTKTYILNNWKVKGHCEVEEMDADIDFELKG